MSTLSLYDLTGIQPYLFGVRRLRASLGASWRAHVALAGLEENGCLGEIAQRKGSALLWSGGGNAVVESPDDPTARRIATALSAHLLEHASGLRFVCAHASWDGSNYPQVMSALQRARDRQKESQFGDARFDGGGVCEACRDTAEPAVENDDESCPIGASVHHRERAANRAGTRLKKLFDPAPRVWSDDIDQLGRTFGEESALGVVHIDGNGMGQHFERATARGLAEVQDLSLRVKRAGAATIVEGLQWVATRIAAGTLGFELRTDRDDRDKTVFPVRPIVFGGDDITLLCDGRIAIDLAAEMLRAWNRQNPDLHAAAGVALVRAHYPFYRAVSQAEALCREAKRWRKKELSADASTLNWSLQRSGGVVAEPRGRTARPYVVVGDPPAGRPWRSWGWFRKDCLLFLQGRHDLHTQIKGIAGPLAAGSEDARRALNRLFDRHGFRLPTPPHHQLDISGFEASETPFLDALELLDLIPKRSP